MDPNLPGPKLRPLKINLDPDARDRLARLVRGTDATSRAMVIRRAIRMYDMLHQQTRKGARLQLHDPDGSRTWVLLF